MFFKENVKIKNGIHGGIIKNRCIIFNNYKALNDYFKKFPNLKSAKRVSAVFSVSEWNNIRILKMQYSINSLFSTLFSSFAVFPLLYDPRNNNTILRNITAEVAYKLILLIHDTDNYK